MLIKLYRYLSMDKSLCFHPVHPLVFFLALISPSDDSDKDISDQESLKSESDSSEDMNNMVRHLHNF